MISLIHTTQITTVLGALLMVISLMYSYLPKEKRIAHVTPDGIMLLGGIITLVSLAVGLYAVEIR